MYIFRPLNLATGSLPPHSSCTLRNGETSPSWDFIGLSYTSSAICFLNQEVSFLLWKPYRISNDPCPPFWTFSAVSVRSKMLCSACQRINTTELKSSAHSIFFSLLVHIVQNYSGITVTFASFNNTCFKRTASCRHYIKMFVSYPGVFWVTFGDDLGNCLSYAW